MSGTELVVITTPSEIAELPAAQRGELITRALVESKQWLAVATKGTDPTPIVEFKAWAATVAEMTKQKGLAEDIQLNALEMVRRAERGIGQAIRNGQEAGDICRPNEGAPGPHRSYDRTRNGRQEHVSASQGAPGETSRKLTTGSFGLGTDQLARQIYPLTDGVTEEDFEVALETARADKNLSNAGVVRKIKAERGPVVPISRRMDEIAELARDGVSSRQMATKFGCSSERVRRLAKSSGIHIPADHLISNTHGIDPERVIRESVNTLEGVAASLNLLRPEDYDAFSVEQLKDWLRAVQEPARAIRNLVKELNSHVRNTNVTRHEEGGAPSPPSLDPDLEDAGVPTGSA